MGLLSDPVPPTGQQTMRQQAQVQNKEQPPENKPMFIPPTSPPPIPGGPDQDFFRYRIEATDIIEEIMHQLKGEIVVTAADGSRSYEEVFDRWVNDEGINKILHVIYSNGLNKNVFLGNLSHEEIMFKMKSLKKKLALLIFQKYHAFEIKKEMRSLIVSTVINQIHSGLSRCEGGRESDQISTATTRLESYATQDKANSDSGFLSHVPFFKKNK